MVLLRRLADRTLDAAFPATCPGCGHEGAPICQVCLPALDARLEQPGGVPLGMPAEIPVALLQVEWCASFTGVVRDALHALKYGGERRLAEPLGRAVARRWDRAGAGGDLIVAVPVHATRARQRGYDQAALIATVAARHLGLPFAPLLVRRRETIAQFDLDRAERSTNVAGAFGLAAGRERTTVGSRWVVLVDDVMTTGATLAACASVLLEAGALAVSAVTVARER